MESLQKICNVFGYEVRDIVVLNESVEENQDK